MDASVAVPAISQRMYANHPCPFPHPGYDRHRPSVWVAEGLVGYLTDKSCSDLLSAVHSAVTPSSVLLMTCPPPPAAREQAAAQGRKLHHTTFEEPESTLARVTTCGWQAELACATALATGDEVQPGALNGYKIGIIQATKASLEVG
eukprot:366286-Chlamydomonas_euryale.AAC.12